MECIEEGNKYQWRQTLQIHLCCTWENIEELICKKIAKLHIWDWWIMNMILYTPFYTQSSQLTRISNIDDFYKRIWEKHKFVNKQPHAMNNLHKVERWICMHEKDTCYRDSIGADVVYESSLIILACLKLPLKLHFFLWVRQASNASPYLTQN